MKNPRLLTRAAALVGLTVLGAGAANAQAVTPRFLSAIASSGSFTYTYQLFLGADTRVSSGNLFTFYDFNGLLTDTANAPTFTGVGGASYAISTPLVGIDPTSTTKLAGDDPTLPNVTLTYNGATLSNPTLLDQNLGALTIHSTNALNGAGDFTPFAANSTKVSNGLQAGNQSFVSGPNNTLTVAVADTPEPGAWAMLVGMGVSGVAFARRRTRRK